MWTWSRATLPAGMMQTPYNLAGADFGNQDQKRRRYGYPVTIGGDGAAGEPDGRLRLQLPTRPSASTATRPAPTATAALGDRVWIDADGDGAQDPEEVGIAGVTGDSVLRSGRRRRVQHADDPGPGGDRTTDANGNYLFDGLPPGAYVVQVTTAASAATPRPATRTTSGRAAAVNDNQTTTPVVLAPGDVFLNADFGYQPPASQNNSIGDKVWFDADADGVGPAACAGRQRHQRVRHPRRDRGPDQGR